ncbi:hypothetical protein E8E13_001826 [Curvularia kusanoi]|uniref:Uncharacterized protein n=1 Tax=Curvularia kusanoi TaxID=90978 RepID=A0A9P4T7B6_CURKU|nr:hypothetical protein E8E13_001826 [Curvularia kusanoi]
MLPINCTDMPNVSSAPAAYRVAKQGKKKTRVVVVGMKRRQIVKQALVMTSTCRQLRAEAPHRLDTMTEFRATPSECILWLRGLSSMQRRGIKNIYTHGDVPTTDEQWDESCEKLNELPDLKRLKILLPANLSQKVSRHSPLLYLRDGVELVLRGGIQD